MRSRMPPFLTTLATGTALGLILACTSAQAGVAGSADARVDELERKLEQSLRQIDSLAARVRELEAAAGAAKPPVTAESPPAVTVTDGPGPSMEKVDAVEQRVAAMETAQATRQTEDRGLALHGFADVDTGNYNPYYPNLKGTSVGSLDFYLAPRLGGQVVSLAELIFEVGPSGMVGTDLERMQIGYEFGDAATLWIGRFHTPYGYVNTALHHGVWIDDALRRPKFLNFEDHGGVMPSHAVGAWLTGAQPEGEGKIRYDLYVGNGQQIQGGLIDMQSGGNEHGTQMLGARLAYQWYQGPLDGLILGLDGFTDKVSNQQTLTLTRLNMGGLYAVYDTDSWENILEAYLFRDTNLNGGPASVRRSDAWFAQFAYRARWGLPYVRYERAALDQQDLYFAGQQFGASYHRSALGIRFDLNAKSSLKFEVARTHTTDYRPGDIVYGLPLDYDEILGQYAVRF